MINNAGKIRTANIGSGEIVNDGEVVGMKKNGEVGK